MLCRETAIHFAVIAVGSSVISALVKVCTNFLAKVHDGFVQKIG